ncbi:aqp-10 [Pristionchus pacificus]|uniref:Aqp-10 n=1 Tax=Pristionchus pacificus TaxID=54126 RepID=A0A2A6B7H2_PRIPA|nr:aqp-10 [Pristionchus pacificus]|eukprot:PDM61814.1 aqp-10 [Pristionchus pacificus]
MSLAQFEPLICAASTYFGVFALAHVAKIGIDRTLKRHTRPHTFALEFITALQMCVCVYENGIIIGNYGLPGFFIAVTLLLIAAGFTNRGHFGNILSHVESLLKGNVAIIDFAVVLAGQFLGSALALKAATGLWYYTAGLSASHSRAVGANLCGFQLLFPLNMVMLLEAGACFVLRILIGAFAAKTTFRRRYIIPVLVAAHLAAAIKYIGVAGLNPMTAYARLAMCPGMNDAHFFFTYWVGAAVGWLMGAHVQQGVEGWLQGRSKARRAAAEEKQREAKREAKKNEKKRK